MKAGRKKCSRHLASKLRRVGLWGFGSALFLGLALCAGAMIPGRTDILDDPRENADETVWLLPGPIHTDFLIRYDALTVAQFGFADLSDATKWIVVGWGSEAFYTATGSYRDMRARTVLRAGTGDSGVLRILPLRFEIADPAAIGAYPVSLTGTQHARLFEAFTTDVIGPALADVHLAPGDQFFPTRGRFGLWRTCNQWVSERLRMSGLRMGWATPLTGSVRLSVWWFGHAKG